MTDKPRELNIDQSHAGTLLLAALFGLLATCVVTIVALAFVWQVASWVGWLLCLFIPAVFLVLLVGHFLFDWSERVLPSLWPSRRRLLLDRRRLTLSRRNRIKSRILWDEPYSALCWRARYDEESLDAGSNRGMLVLACQLTQSHDMICVFTASSAKDWRRVPGWKQFPLLEGAQRQSLGRLEEHTIASMPRTRGAPSHRGISSMVQGNPKELWPAELRRRRGGWELSFEDFCAVMCVVERSIQERESDD